MDAFFASIEQKDNPLLRGKPLIVGGSPESRGVVAACSYEARRYGIHSAMPCAKAARLCPKAIFTRPRMARYKEVSAEVMKIFHQYTHLVEPLSLDEAFLDVTLNSQNHPSATHLARTICSHIHREVGLTASAGVSFNKFLAKVASDVNKPAGITIVPPENGIAFLAGLPIRKFFGVGRVTEQKMLRLGIKTGYDLRQWELEKLIFHFGKTGSFLHDIVRDHDFPTITKTRTLHNFIRTCDDIVALLPQLLASTKTGSLKIRLLGLSVSKLCDGKNTPRQLLLPFMKGNLL